MNSVIMLAGVVSSVLSGLVSLLVSYWPALQEQFKKLPSHKKSLVMFLVIACVSVVTTYLVCTGTLSEYVNIQCVNPTLIDYFMVIILSLSANQSIFMMTPSKKAVSPEDADELLKLLWNTPIDQLEEKK